MYSLNEKEYLGFSHATYIENESVQYKIKGEKRILTEHQKPHFHDDVTLFFVTDGNATLFVNSEPNLISPGDLVMLMPYHVHSVKLISESLTVYHCNVSLGLLLFSSISRAAEKHISYSLAYGNVIASFAGKEQNSMRNNFEELIEELSSDHLLNTMVGLSMAIKIILLFSRTIAENIEKKQLPDHTLNWKLLQYLNTHFSRDLSAKSIAAEFSLNPLHVNQYFYLLTGENLATNLHRTRIRYACCMLQFEQLSSTFIGNYVGYKNSASFFRKFKELKYITPDEYRKNHVPEDSIFKPLNYSWKILLYLFEHYSEPLTEASISQALFLSPDTIQMELITNFDISLSDLLTKIRLQYACSFLQVLDEPVLKISYLCGFSSLRTFNRCFKEQTGCTPLEYKNKKRS